MPETEKSMETMAFQANFSARSVFHPGSLSQRTCNGNARESGTVAAMPGILRGVGVPAL